MEFSGAPCSQEGLKEGDVVVCVRTYKINYYSVGKEYTLTISPRTGRLCVVSNEGTYATGTSADWFLVFQTKPKETKPKGFAGWIRRIEDAV